MVWHKQGGIPGGTVLALATTGQICLAGTLAGLHLSEDGGLAWTQIRYGDAVQALALATNGAAFAACASGRLLGSADGGRSWREISSWQFGTATAVVLAPDFASRPHVFVATADGIFRSMDGGETWQEANFGLLDTEVLCLAIAPDYAESELLWAGTANGGLYRSRNAGRAWREGGDGLAEGAIAALAVSPHFGQDRTLFAGLGNADVGNADGDEDIGGGVFVSTDAGESWQPAGCDDEINSLAISLDGKRMLVAGAEHVHAYDIATAAWARLADLQAMTLVWVSPARLLAGTWAEGVAIFNVGHLAWDRDTTLSARVLPVVMAGGRGLLALDSLGHVLASPDHGESWAEIGLLEGAQGFAGGADAAGPALVVTARDLQVWDGARWRAIGLPMLGAGDEARVAHARMQRELMLGTQLGGVYLSTDGAATWFQLPALAAGTAVLGVHASRSGRLYALGMRATGEREFAAEVWLCESMSAPAWQLLIALDGLAAPLAAMQVCEGAPAERVILAAQNHLVSRETGGDSEPELFAFDSSAVVTALQASPRFADDGMLFAATNAGVLQLRREPGGWTQVAHALADRPIVSLFEDEGRVGAVVLGGEVWRCDGPLATN